MRSIHTYKSTIQTLKDLYNFSFYFFYTERTVKQLSEQLQKRWFQISKKKRREQYEKQHTFLIYNSFLEWSLYITICLDNESTDLHKLFTTALGQYSEELVRKNKEETNRKSEKTEKSTVTCWRQYFCGKLYQGVTTSALAQLLNQKYAIMQLTKNADTVFNYNYSQYQMI